MCYPICWMVHIKDPLLLLIKWQQLVSYLAIQVVFYHMTVNKMC